jgi:phospholipid/cholesterol/gamma-HCH transport system substrate-binding protein
LIKRAPNAGSIVAMVLFALSCFGLLLYLWISFGGATPLKPMGYRFEISFPEASQLADGADVRIAGVSVGRVVGSRLDEGRVTATVELTDSHAPIPRDTRALLRTKTLLGETFVELAPGDGRAGALPDGGRLDVARVAETVQLDELLETFDPGTRRALRRVTAGSATSLDGRGLDLNAALGQLPLFAEHSNRALAVLDSEEEAMRGLVRDTGQMLGALGEQEGELASLVRSVDTVMTTTARRDESLRETIRLLPATLDELRTTMRAAEDLSRRAGPAIAALRPAGRELAPALRDAGALAPEVEATFVKVDRLTAASRQGLPDTTQTLDALRTLLRAVDPALRQLVPVLDYVGVFRREVAAGFTNLAAATQASAPSAPGGRRIRYLRALPLFGAEAAVASARRYGSNRHNAYFGPGAMEQLAEGLRSLDCRHAGRPPEPDPAPPCVEQEPFEFGGQRLDFPHVEADD